MVDVGVGGTMVTGSGIGWVAFAGHGSTVVVVAGVGDFQNCHDKDRLNTNWEEFIGNNLDEEVKFRTE
jgi:hypothetical protein